MREGKRAPTVVGGISLLVIFAVLCLTVFAVLSLAQGQADRRLAQSSWSAVTGYYRADCQAQEILSRAAGGGAPPGRDGRGGEYVLLCLPHLRYPDAAGPGASGGGDYEILGWQAEFTADWQADDDLDLWDGST